MVVNTILVLNPKTQNTTPLKVLRPFPQCSTGSCRIDKSATIYITLKRIAMKELKDKQAKVINAQFRGQIGRVVLTLDSRDVIFAHPKVLNNTLGLKLDPISVRKLIGGTLYYEAADVAKGEEFRWNRTADEVQVAESDLAIRNVTSIIPTDANEVWLSEHCEPVETASSWDEIVGGESNDDSDDDEVPEGATEEPADEEPADEEPAKDKADAKPKGTAKQVK